MNRNVVNCSGPIEDLCDVKVTSPSSGQVLAYDTTTETWKNSSSGGSGGPQGAQGNKGDQGVKGSQGAQGAQGSQGAQGTQGNTGAQGAQGATASVVIGHNWNRSTLGMTGTTGSIDLVTLQGSSEIDRFFRFRSGGGAPNGRTGVMLTAYDGHAYSLASGTGSDGLPLGDFKIYHNTTLPSTYDDLGRPIFGIEEDTLGVQFHNPQGPQGITLVHDVTNLTSSETATWQDSSGTVAWLTDVTPGPQGAQGPVGAQGNTGAQGSIANEYGFYAIKLGDQSIPNNTETTVTSWSVTGEGNDPSSSFNTSTGIWTVPITGFWNIMLTASFNTSGTGYRRYQIKDGGNVIAGSVSNPNSSAGDVCTCGADHIYLTSGTTINITAFQNSGGALNTQSGGFFTFGATLIGSTLGPTGATGAQGAQGPTGGITDVGFFVGTLQTAPLSVANATNATLKWPNDTTQPYNNVGNNYDKTTGKYTVPTTGYYSFSASLVPTASNGVGIRSFVLQRNGGTVERDILGSSTISSNSSAITDALNVSCDHVYCSSGDYVQCGIYQTSGGSLSVYGNFGGKRSF